MDSKIRVVWATGANHLLIRKKTKPLIYQFFLNVWPCLNRTGGRVIYISENFDRLKVRLKLTWRTRNLVGTIYGGSLYASTDPFYMFLLMQLLGKSYVVWDKGCTIRFKRPAQETLVADFHVTPEMLKEAHQTADAQGEHTFTWKLEYRGEKSGILYAEFDKVLYVATKPFYEEKLRKRAQKTNL